MMAGYQMRDQLPRLVRCELLTYVFSYMHRFPRDKLAKTIVKFYRTEEISLAKDLLWEFYEPQLGEKKLRHNKKEISNEMETRDIIKAALELDKKQAYGKEVVFAATNVERVPKPTPEEGIVLALIDRVSVLEAQVADLNKIKDCQDPKLRNNHRYSVDFPDGLVAESGAKRAMDIRGGQETHNQNKYADLKSKDVYEVEALDSGRDNVKLLGNDGTKKDKRGSNGDSKKEQDCIIS